MEGSTGAAKGEGKEKHSAVESTKVGGAGAYYRRV
jgi:hypothetical protein